jgi:hypothetical protein
VKATSSSYTGNCKRGPARLTSPGPWHPTIKESSA